MSTTEIQSRLASMPDAQNVHDYNFEHFRTKHLLADMKASAEKRGIAAGQLAPDFELNRVGGGSLRLSDLRGRPVLLHFGSFT